MPSPMPARPAGDQRHPPVEVRPRALPLRVRTAPSHGRRAAASGTMEGMPVLALTPLTDVTDWLRSSGLEIVIIVLSAVLVARFANWLEGRITRRIDAGSRVDDALVRSEAAKHRHAVAQVLTWLTVVIVYCLTAVLVVQRLGIPISGLVAPATVAGVALGFGAQRIVQDLLAGFFLIAERQYGFGDVVRISPLGSDTGVTGTVEDLTLRITRLRSSNGEVVIVPNGQIVQVTNLSRDWARAAVDVPLPDSVDVAQVNALLHEVGVAAFEDPRAAAAAARRPDRDGRREPGRRRAHRPRRRPHPARQAVRGRPGAARAHRGGVPRPGASGCRPGSTPPSRPGRADAAAHDAVSGRLRTSTVGLVLLLLALVALYLQVRPVPASVATTRSSTAATPKPASGRGRRARPDDPGPDRPGERAAGDRAARAGAPRARPAGTRHADPDARLLVADTGSVEPRGRGRHDAVGAQHLVARQTGPGDRGPCRRVSRAAMPRSATGPSSSRPDRAIEVRVGACREPRRPGRRGPRPGAESALDDRRDAHAEVAVDDHDLAAGDEAAVDEHVHGGVGGAVELEHGARPEGEQLAQRAA